MNEQRHRQNIRRIVVKVGSNTLTAAGGRLDRRFIASLVDQISECVHSGHEVVLVTSGAIAAGLEVLGVATRPDADDIAGLQAAASVGQVALIEAYASEFGRRGLNAGQVLLTRSDTENKVSYDHACNTFERLLSLRAVPVVNENDTVAVEEIRYSDNDALAALVAQMIGAQLVIVLTDVNGLYDADPRTVVDAALIERARGVDDELLARVQVDKGGSNLGSGGMRSKLEAARTLALSGIDTVLCNGRTANAVIDAVSGTPHGTLIERIG